MLTNTIFYYFTSGLCLIILLFFSIECNSSHCLSDNNLWQELKQPVEGLVSMGYVGGILRHRGRNGTYSDGTGSPAEDLNDVFSKPIIFSGAVLNLSWKELEPARGRLTTTVIDDALERVRDYNKKYPDTPLLLRLRVSCGRAAPDWAKSTGGEPVHILDPKGNYFYIGRFWADEYKEAWRCFQNRLAAIYDDEPLIADVTVTSGMTNSDENMNLATNSYSLKNMHAAGFNDSLFVKIIKDCGEDYSAWIKTRIVFLINPFRFSDSGKPTFDNEFTISLMKLFKNKYGERAILSNHAFQCCPRTERLDFIYQSLKQLGPPFDLQTHSPKTIDMEATVTEAAAMGATTLELWNEYVNYHDDVLLRWKQLFEQNKNY
jgi:hypothetical protein